MALQLLCVKDMKTIALNPKLFLSFAILFSTQHAVAGNPTVEREIVVAIIDTGVDENHPLIADRLWKNPNEKKGTIDNDGNGFAGDIHGWNFASNDSNISDQHGHGTHVAGIILQKSQSEKVKFMILKYFDSQKSGAENLANTIKAIRYAIKMKADIINYSGGGDTRSPLEEAAIREAQEEGILFVAAAGNDGRNTDQIGYYPAGYALSNIISVAAMDSHKRLLANSNYGAHSVDLVAPGKNIFSTLPGGRFGFMTGTSMATAWVSGLVASLMVKTNKNWRPEDIKKFLERVAVKDQKLSNKIRTQSRISNIQVASHINP